jgi:hypothetical protein
MNMLSLLDAAARSCASVLNANRLLAVTTRSGTGVERLTASATAGGKIRASDWADGPDVPHAVSQAKPTAKLAPMVASNPCLTLNFTDGLLNRLQIVSGVIHYDGHCCSM